MTDQRLRDLLEERVADVSMPDLSAAAWRDGRRTRRRDRLVATGCVVLVGAVVSVGVAVVGDRGRSTDPAPAPGVPTSTATPPATPEDPETPATPDSRYRGAPVWSAPSLVEEAGLPPLGTTVLPPEIDLAPGEVVSGLGRAVGVLGVWPEGNLSRVVAVGADGGSYALDIEEVLGPVADEQGNVIAALTQDGLSPDGQHVFFIQERSLEIYDFGTDRWTHVDTPAWLAEGTRWVAPGLLRVPDRPGSDEGTTYGVDGREVGDASGPTEAPSPAWTEEDAPFGPLEAGWGESAQGHFVVDEVTLGGTSYAGLDAVVATDDGAPHLLVFPPLDDRWKGCCPVVGWVAPGTVLLESRHAGARVLAWRVGTDDVRQVSSIIGWRAGLESYVASWAVTPDRV